MAGADWVEGLTVVKLKEQLKKRGQPVSGKKAELVERLQQYIAQHEVRGCVFSVGGVRGVCLGSVCVQVSGSQPVGPVSV